MVAAAGALEAAADELVTLAEAETGLSETRLRGELRRTAVQLRLFADVVVEGGYLDARIDEGDPGFALGPRPDLRRVLVPLGPVLNFAASNFPFAFSVAGGDSAAALAAGCPVIVKAHPGHPRLSERTAEIVSGALTAAGMPVGTFQLAVGQDAGVELLKDERIRAGSFTGSLRAGSILARIAAERPRPIPFFGELGSVNPVFATAAAVAERGSDIAAGFATSVSGSAGQLCTKPGFLFLPAGHGLDDDIAAGVGAAAEHRLLTPSISAGYADRRETILATSGIRTMAEGSVRVDGDDAWVTPTIVSTTLAGLEKHADRLLDESFGPLSIVVEYEPGTPLDHVVTDLFDGNLTGTVQIGEGENSAELVRLVAALTETCGRVLFNGWPTGVAVTPAMQHGGPWPATTSGGTSVGTAAIERFLRGVSYQNAPDGLLPAPLQDANPWNVPRQTAPAGASAHWGELASGE
jgi:NADP-dependent aldehyde dehydrogenase